MFRSLNAGLSALLVLWLALCTATPVAAGEDNTIWSEIRRSVHSVWDAVGAALGGGEPFQRLWNDLLPELDAVLGLQDKIEGLPESRLFGADQASVRGEIDVLLDECIEILGVSHAARLRARLSELSGQRRTRQNALGELRQKRIAARDQAVWDRRIAAQQAEIDAIDAELEETTATFAAALGEMGLELNRAELDFLLTTVVGDEVIRMGVAYSNVKAVTLGLERLVEESLEAVVPARRYYGMYTVLLRILDRIYTQLGADIKLRYLPEITRISARIEQLSRETARLSRRSGTSRAVLRANREAQRLSLRAAREYRAYLIAQRDEVLKVRQALAPDLAVALNTYETVKISGDLLALMRASQNRLVVLDGLRVPKLKVFDNRMMKREFVRLSAKIAAGLDGNPR